ALTAASSEGVGSASEEVGVKVRASSISAAPREPDNDEAVEMNPVVRIGLERQLLSEAGCGVSPVATREPQQMPELMDRAYCHLSDSEARSVSPDSAFHLDT